MDTLADYLTDDKGTYYIICHLLGLNGYQNTSYGEIGKMLGVSGSAVSERARKLVKKLRKDPRVIAYYERS